MAKRKRSGVMVIVASAAVLTAVVMAWPTNPTDPTKVEVTQPAVPQKPGVSYVIIESGQPAPKGIAPPVELHIHGVSATECQQMGGTYQARNSMCLDVDY